MATALVVDDSKAEQLIAGALLQKKCGLDVAYAANGTEALTAIARRRPDLVVTDLQMPEMDGLALVESVREQFPVVPVILMTAHGSEDLAAEALRRGAAGYVPKRLLARELEGMVAAVLAAATAHGEKREVLASLTASSARFELENDIALIPPLIGYLQHQVVLVDLCDDTGVTRLGMALNEALSNAIHHGNLEVDSRLREQGMDVYLGLLEERRRTAPWSGRRVHVAATFSHAEAVFSIRDLGKGFDPRTLPDPTDPENLLRESGRGVTLMRMLMDEVRFSESGNEVTLVLRKTEAEDVSDGA